MHAGRSEEHASDAMNFVPVDTRQQGDHEVIMADTVNKETRSRMMSSVRSKNTKLEMEIRRRLFDRGFRYRLHGKNLPGTPDMIFPKYRAVLFVHGCFWHYHGCHLSGLPDTRRSWWKKKLEGNKKRDSEVISELEALGWRILIIWECGFRKPKLDRAKALDRIAERAASFLKSEMMLLEIPRVSRGRKSGKSGKGRTHGNDK